ncbi:MAG TPA: TonB family protein [Vicinamibacterales bacterium]|jgi:TonB family protein
MADAQFKGASPNSQFLVGELPHGQVKTSWWEGTGVSIVAHVLLLGLFIYTATHARQIVQTVTDVPTKLDFIFLPQKGPGGGGGGRPKDFEPPRKAEIVASKPVEVKPIPKPANVPMPDITVPLQTANAVQTLPGSISGLEVPTGTGSGSNGRGSGIGNGTGSGVGEGSGGGIGGGVYQIGNGVTSPVLMREVKPNYTGDAMRAKLQGVVEMECVVLPDGTVDPKSIKITRSLDSTFGLDQQAVIAVKQWRFRPGMFKGQPVPVIVNVELTFTLR